MSHLLRLAPFLSLVAFATGASAATEKAMFAGGCYWSMESAFEEQPGVIAAVSGFAGGHVPNPTYRQVIEGHTGHIETVEVTFDTTKTNYRQLLNVYWHHVDPFDAEGQFCDKGPNYRSAIFVLNDAQRAAATDTQNQIDKALGKRTVTTIRPAAPFYAADDEHQDFVEKQPLAYRAYNRGCGRNARLAEIWGGKP